MKRIGKTAAIAAAITFANSSLAAGSADEATALRAELEATRAAFTARIEALESRLNQLEGSGSRAGGTPPVATERLDLMENRLQRVETASAQAAVPVEPAPSAFNPRMSLILGGTWANLANDPEDYRLQGFVPGSDEGGPGERSFSLGESEMTFSANIDPLFSGQATFAVTPDNEIEVEEAFVRATALPQGLGAQFGRFYSALGYVNAQHAHAWDFVDAPLVYQAMFGGQYRNDGLQLKWLAPLDTFVELGMELSSGREFPGSDDGNGVGAYTLFAAAGNDIGDSASWKAGVAWLRADATERGYEEPDALLEDTANPTAFSGDSATWSSYAVYKWAPGGNSRERNLKLQGEYFQREEQGSLAQLNATRGEGVMDYRSSQSGWYLQGIYQFMPSWRIGMRWDSLDSGDPRLLSLDGVLRPAAFPTLAGYEPERGTVMLDYAPTEFSRLRLQYAHDDSAPGDSDEQVYLQYLMSLGAHGAHQF